MLDQQYLTITTKDTITLHAEMRTLKYKPLTDMPISDPSNYQNCLGAIDKVPTKEQTEEHVIMIIKSIPKNDNWK
ncbi:UNVERIFIED_CONTAM: hypothetical protein HDU68_006212, partial [Siphonaria sp. JEL0065]